MPDTLYTGLQVEIDQGIARVTLNRPNKANALNLSLWEEIGRAFQQLDRDPAIRVCILAGAGKHFCSGIDLMDFAGVLASQEKCEARKRDRLRQLVLKLQGCLSAIDRCSKPVLASIQGACVGGGVDIVAACDMRYASTDAFFSIKEIDIGMTADVGTLQRLPHIIGDGLMRELAYTGRRMETAEAERSGMINRAFDSAEALHAGVTELAREIARKSPLAIKGTKEMIRYARDHTVEDGLNYVATWNAAMLIGEDIQKAMLARMRNATPVFEDLAEAP